MATRTAFIDTKQARRLAVAVASVAAGVVVGRLARRTGTADRLLGAEVERLGDEQAALRRVATLVAQQAAPEDVFALIVAELGALLGADDMRMVRYDGAREAMIVAGWGAFQRTLPVGTRIPLDDGVSLSARVRDTERPARIDDYGAVGGEAAAFLSAAGVRAAVGTPIVVEGRVWGAMLVGRATAGALPGDTEARAGAFSELAATAIANSEARREVQRLADEQAALRRVATLVAEEARPDAVFLKVAEEMATVLGIERTMMTRFEADAVAVVADWNNTGRPSVPPGTRRSLEGDNLNTRVHRTGRAARMDDYGAANGSMAELGRGHHVAGGVGCPITVHGRLWGALIAIMHDAEPLPPDTEARMGEFSELVATAIGNAEARAEAARLTAEQAALRRIATLVAEGAAPPVVFDAVTVEIAELLNASQIALLRFDPGPTATVLAHRGRDAERAPVGTSVPLDRHSLNATVHRTGAPTRMDAFDDAEGSIMYGVADLQTAIGTPIVVDGKLWGSIAGAWLGDEPAPAEAEQRLTEFAELAAVAVANADSREQLTASRARMLEAADEARRRVVRDLHDGAQQRLVHTIVTLRMASQALDQGDEGVGAARELVGEAVEQATRSNEELRELAQGILPAALTRHGLQAGVGSLVSGLDLPVVVDVELPDERFPAAVEASAYFVVAEALTNIIKHARATQATVRASIVDGVLRVEVQDDGVGGADVSGNGLVGISDRVTALGGHLRIQSPAGAGTIVTAMLPVAE